jgi:hypothetical protein
MRPSPASLARPWAAHVAARLSVLTMLAALAAVATLATRPRAAQAGPTGPVLAAPSAASPAAACPAGRASCDGNPASGCEADLARDRRHCGRCTRACEAACREGACEPVTLASGPAILPCIALSGGGVHWARTKRNPSGNGVSFEVMRAETTARPGAARVVRSFDAPRAGARCGGLAVGEGGSWLVVDRFHVRGAQTGAPRPELGPIVSVAGAPGLTAIATTRGAGDRDGTIGVVDGMTGVGRLLATLQESPSAVTIDGDTVYWATLGRNGDADDGTVMRTPLAGGLLTLLATGRKHPSGIAATGGTVYWTERGSDAAGRRDGGVHAMASGATTPTTVVAGAVDARELVEHGGRLFWIETDPAAPRGTSGVIRAAAATASPAGDATQLVAARLAAPTSLQADDRYVYFTTSDPTGARVSVQRVAW